MKRRICTIVGAGEGLGQALAAKFAGQSFDIALMSRTEAGSAAAAQAAAAANDAADVRFFRADATRPNTLESALANIGSDMGAIDVLIYNARGQFTACEPLDMTYEALEEVYRVEVVGAFAAAKSVLPTMIGRSRGSIFFSSATAAFRGSSNFPLYAIGKFGLRALSQSLAKAYAKDGVHIVHFRLDCDLDVPVMRELYGDQRAQTGLASPDDVAETYWLTYQQPKGAWSNEVEIRPYTETWTY
ncbi:MAG: SDR family NAD(P)-dependent oxidoreductase [Pseudomonadota bacterium]